MKSNVRIPVSTFINESINMRASLKSVMGESTFLNFRIKTAKNLIPTYQQIKNIRTQILTF